jgi:hypothetical protein
LYDVSGSGIIGRYYTSTLTNYENQWIHLIATYDGSVSTSGIRLYLNGIRIDNSNTNGGTYVAMESTGTNFRIGTDGEGIY